MPIMNTEPRFKFGATFLLISKVVVWEELYEVSKNKRNHLDHNSNVSFILCQFGAYFKEWMLIRKRRLDLDHNSKRLNY